jgi:hypothetical protein
MTSGYLDRPMPWYLSVDGVVSGPHEEAAVLALIARGGVRNAQIRNGEKESWRPIDAHPPFADALRRHSPTVRLSRPPKA